MTTPAATVPVRRRHLGLLGAVSLPLGGFLAVDLFRPHQPIHLFPGSEAQTDPSIARIVQALDASTALPPDAALPTEWIRLAVVAGVTRWLSHPLDEELLAADRAHALWAAGDPEGAGEIFGRPEVAEKLFSLAERIVSRPHAHGTDALRSEAVRVLRAAAATSNDGFSDALQLIAESELVGTLGGRGDDSDGGYLLLRGVDAVFDVRMQALDRLHVPARLLQGFDVGVRADTHTGNIKVIAPAYPTAVRRPAAASRLLARVYQRESGDVVSLGALELTVDDQGRDVFEVTLPLRGHDPASVEIDVYDGAGLSAPRAGAEGRALRAALAVAQDAFEDWRLARAAAARGDFAVVREREAAAVERLVGLRELEGIREGGELGVELANLADAYRPEVVTSTVESADSPSRPLLAELDAESRPGGGR